MSERFRALLPVVLAAAILAAGVETGAQKPGAAIAFDRYHSVPEIGAAIAALHKANPAVTALHTLATSPGGSALTALEIGPEAGQKGRSLPAVLVVANLEGVFPISAEAALYLADQLLQNPAAFKATTWYILPNANPDAAARFAGKPLLADERNATRHNDDMDDQVDEDGPEDLDGNGIITEMRVKDPAGEWIPVDGEPRLMRKADTSKGEKGVYKIYQEGVDNDGDGEINEDPPGGANLGLTFPHLFKQWTATGGRWPGSEPETFGLMKFAIDHPEIAMTVSLGATNLCLQPPAGGRQGSFDANAVKVPERIAARVGADPNRTYSIKEIIEMVRPMAPPGFEITESMIASFLGLGAVVNPLDEDLKFYKELSDKYKEHLKAAKLDAKRLDPVQPKDGSFELWSYYHLGVPTFSLDFWTLPEAKTEEKEKSGITAESLEAMTPEAFVALGEAKIATFLKEVGAPENIKPAMLLEGVKAGKMTPRQMAGMLKQVPKPKDATGGDPKQRAWLAFSDKDLGGKGFAKWTPVSHPTFGEVEVGGFVPFGDTTPPATLVKPLLEGQVPWIVKLAERLPRLRILKSEVEPKGGGVYGVSLWVENAGALPFPTAMGQKNQHVAPAVVTLEGKGLTFLSGRARTAIPAVDAGRSAKLQWLVQAPAAAAVEARLQSANAWGDTATITLAQAQGGVK
jgi:hypothetical protein